MQSDIVPVSSTEKGFRPRTLHSGDFDSTGGSITSDQDNPEAPGNFLSPPKSAKSSNDDSLTFSEDSDTTRIYNLNTRETKIVVPAEEKRVDSPIESPVKGAQQFQFFRSSSKTVSKVRKMDDEVTTVIRTSNRNLINGTEDSVSVSSSWNCYPRDNIYKRIILAWSGSHRGRNLRGETSHRAGGC